MRLRGTEEMDEINEPAPPSDRRQAFVDRLKTALKDTLPGTEKNLQFIEEIGVSGDDSVAELTWKILQGISETDTETLLGSGLLPTLEKIIKELYPELWVVHVDKWIVIADSVWQYIFAPQKSTFRPDIAILLKLQQYIGQMEKNHMRLQVYTDIDIDRCFVKMKAAEIIPEPVKELYKQLKKKQLKICKEEKENHHSHPPNHVVKIDDNGVLKVDKGKTKSLNTFLKFYGNRVFQPHSTDANRLATWAALYGMQWAQLSVLGNPLDKLSQSRGNDPMELSMGKACSITVWTSIFFLNFIFAAMLTLSLPHRIPAYSMLGFSLLYYILAITVAMSGYSVSWGDSAKMSGLLFVFGGATGLMLLLSIIIIGVLYAAWCSSPNDVGRELTEKHSPECIIKFQDT